eukprot:scaffold60553_cov15-Tisochrysis_lutea.AAC.1
MHIKCDIALYANADPYTYRVFFSNKSQVDGHSLAVLEKEKGAQHKASCSCSPHSWAKCAATYLYSGQQSTDIQNCFNPSCSSLKLPKLHGQCTQFITQYLGSSTVRQSLRLQERMVKHATI